jgi:hypothetical protein
MNVPGFEKEVSEFLEYVYHATIGSGDSLEIPGTRENLQNAIKQYGKNILQFHFNEYFQNYTPLEYAIKIGDPEAVRAILSFGSDLHSPQVKGSIAYFYLFQLSTNPQLAEKFKDFPELLEFAVKKMFQNKKIDWEIIDILLPLGLKWDCQGNSTIFGMFRDCEQNKIASGIYRSAEEEKVHLENLIHYLTLEKKHYPNTSSSLTLKQFQTYAERNKLQISGCTTSMDAGNTILGFVSQTNEEMKKESSMLPGSTSSLDMDDETVSEFASNFIIESEFFISQNNYALTGQLMHVCTYIKLLHDWFTSLVKEGKLKDCFQAWELNPIIQALDNRKNKEPFFNLFLIRLNQWDLNPTKWKSDS